MKQIDVLIIDDEVKFAAMLSKRLELRGVVCDICYDGASGLEKLKSAAFKVDPLVLLDLNLPDIYGIQVMKQIRQLNPSIPVVIVTGHGTESDRQECMRLGAVAFVNKPVKIDQIIGFLNLENGDES